MTDELITDPRILQYKGQTREQIQKLIDGALPQFYGPGVGNEITERRESTLCWAHSRECDFGAQLRGLPSRGLMCFGQYHACNGPGEGILGLCLKCEPEIIGERRSDGQGATDVVR